MQNLHEPQDSDPEGSAVGEVLEALASDFSVKLGGLAPLGLAHALSDVWLETARGFNTPAAAVVSLILGLQTCACVLLARDALKVEGDFIRLGGGHPPKALRGQFRHLAVSCLAIGVGSATLIAAALSVLSANQDSLAAPQLSRLTTWTTWPSGVLVAAALIWRYPSRANQRMAAYRRVHRHRRVVRWLWTGLLIISGASSVFLVGVLPALDSPWRVGWPLPITLLLSVPAFQRQRRLFDPHFD